MQGETSSQASAIDTRSTGKAGRLIEADATHSRFVQRVRRRYGERLGLLPPGRPDKSNMQALVSLALAQGASLAGALRMLRQFVIERLAVLDVEQGAPLADVTCTMTELAEVTLGLALPEACRELDARHGVPRIADGRRAAFWIVGMGKLGGRELNVSSDIDLVYVYDEDGETDGVGPEAKGSITNQEYFARLTRRLYALIGDVTDDGFVFRIDLALRPNGNSGAPVVSLATLDSYLQTQGREWERFAWLKSRVVAPLDADSLERAGALRTIVLPFVFRRYLDYGVFEALRQLHRQIREHAARRAAGHPERANDVKLSRGGIREIEFIVQLLQVVRGGQFPEIRTRSTLLALERLNGVGLLTTERARDLGEAYVFLRRLEHRIQYLDDQQTHVLPGNDDDLRWLAASLGLLSVDTQSGHECCRLLETLGRHRELVAAEFDALLNKENPDSTGCVHGRCCNQPLPALDDPAFVDTLPTAMRDWLLRWNAGGRLRQLGEGGRAKFTRLIRRTAGRVVSGEAAEAGAVRFLDWLEPLLRRESYLSLLLERPVVHQRLLRLLGMARWPARYVMQHPSVVDELASTDMFGERFDTLVYEDELARRRHSLASTGEDDEEALLGVLRRAHHAELFRTLARDVEGKLTVEQVADDLSDLADATLKVAVAWCWDHARRRHRDEPALAIIGYGKLGGKELGYGSDLDIVFVYDDPDERAGEIYAEFVRKLINWLTVRTAEGDLFEIDTALRPNGNSGLLVTSLDAFETYQLGRGSNTAWTWEHQALTRARCVLGPERVAERFEDIRRRVICAPRDPVALRDEVLSMRERVREAHPSKAGQFDVKQGPGGMVDIEFCVQYLVLVHAAQYPELLDDVGNIALLRRAERAGLLPPGIGTQAADAYRELRRIQHRARLDEASTLIDPGLAQQEQQSGRRLWQCVLGERGDAQPVGGIPS